MKMNSTKVSDIIKQECCGVGLSLCNPKADLVKRIEVLETENAFLKNQLNNAINKIAELSKTEKPSINESISCSFNKEKALHEFVSWLNKSGVSFQHISKFNNKCPELAALLNL